MPFWLRLGSRALVIAVTLAAVFLSARALLVRQGAIARARIGKPLGEDSLNADRVWRKSLDGSPIKLLLLGDSLAAGLGAQRRKETLGARIARSLAREVQRPVRLRTAAVVGSESHELAAQLESLPAGYRPDVAIIVVGGNDVTHLNSAESAAKHLEETIRSLRRRDAAVVVGTCPDLGTLRAVPQPLRTFLSRMSARMAALQTRASLRAGAIPVNLRRSVGPVFRAEPGQMFSVDNFHPSAAGYRRTADALLPAVIEAMEFPPNS